jgi:hypothetical protein
MHFVWWIPTMTAIMLAKSELALMIAYCLYENDQISEPVIQLEQLFQKLELCSHKGSNSHVSQFSFLLEKFQT